MTCAPSGTFGATVQGALAGGSVVNALAPAGPHAAAFSARSVAGEAASPGTGLVRSCGVFGEESGCEGVLSTGCVVAVSLFSEGLGSPRLRDIESVELAKENSRGSLKTGGGDFTGLLASAGPLRFFDRGFPDAVLPSFGSLTRLFGAVSAMVASVEAEIEFFFGLPRFWGALSTATGSAYSTP